MPTIDDFVRPKEWVSEFVSDMGRAIRTWGQERYMPIRQQIDEDWQEHALVKPLLKEVLVDFGLNAAFFPREAGGMDMPEVMTIANVMSEELARIDSGFAVACMCSVWGLMPMLLPPHRNMELCMEFGPKFCGEELYVGCHVRGDHEERVRDHQGVDRGQGCGRQASQRAQPCRGHAV